MITGVGRAVFYVKKNARISHRRAAHTAAGKGRHDSLGDYRLRPDFKDIYYSAERTG